MKYIDKVIDDGEILLDVCNNNDFEFIIRTNDRCKFILDYFADNKQFEGVVINIEDTYLTIKQNNEKEVNLFFVEINDIITI